MNTSNEPCVGVQCIMHKACNLRCKFCFETKEKGIRENTDIDVNYIRHMPEEVVSSILPYMKEHGIKKLTPVVMGGELFSDNISDSLFKEYEICVKKIESESRKVIPDLTFYPYFFTNGMFLKRDRVYNFLKKFRSNIILSYDSIDRFTSDKQKEIWYDTFKYFSNISGFETIINITLTKRAMQAYIDGDEIFERIPDNALIDSHEYSPRVDYKGYMPSDDDIFAFYKWALDNGKFNISGLTEVIENIDTCNQGRMYIFAKDYSNDYGRNYISDCTEEIPMDRDFYFGNKTKELVSKGNGFSFKPNMCFQKRGCLTCEYFKQCPKVCWKQFLFDKYEISECPNKRVYEYLEQNPNIKNNYIKWRDRNGKEYRCF